MRQETVATLNELESAEWLSSVGKNDLSQAVIVSSWKKAIELCSSDSWQAILMEGSNQLSDKVFERDQQRFNQWNDVLKSLEPTAVNLVRLKTAKTVIANSLPKIFTQTVEWDILMLLMECEYSDICPPPGHFGAKAFFYIKGHFPCGWEGDYPQGRLIVY